LGGIWRICFKGLLEIYIKYFPKLGNRMISKIFIKDCLSFLKKKKELKYKRCNFLKEVAGQRNYIYNFSSSSYNN